MDHKTFYDYQAQAFRWGRKTIPDENCQIVIPTGGGKTTLGVALLTELQGPDNPFSHGMIAVPQTHIGQHYLADRDRTLAIGDELLEVPEGKLSWLKDTSDFTRYLVSQRPDNSLAVSHQRFQSFVLSAVCPEDLSGCLLLDEAHHAPADTLGRAVDRFLARGGRLVQATATPFRDGGHPMVWPDINVFA